MPDIFLFEDEDAHNRKLFLFLIFKVEIGLERRSL